MSSSLRLSPRHPSLLLRHLHLLPTAYESAGGDTQRLTLVYFALAALDLLGARAKVEEERKEWTEWIWNRQSEDGGFRASSAFELPGSSSVSQSGDLAQTYTALLSLGVLRDASLSSRLDVPALCALLGRCQKEDGSFRSNPADPASDVRFVYCAFAICDLLGAEAWRAIDVDAAVRYLMRCRTFEGAFSQTPGMESHAGSTYCALSSLSLSSRLSSALSAAEQADTTRWLLALQHPGSGFCGRVGKEEDVCYSFWSGASLSILGAHQHIDAPSDAAWLLSAQHAIGGLGKTPGEVPDLLHSYLGLAALSLHVHSSSSSDSSSDSSSSSDDDDDDDGGGEDGSGGGEGGEEQAQAQRAEKQRGAGDGDVGVGVGKEEIGRLDAAMNCTRETRQWLRETLGTHDGQ